MSFQKRQKLSKSVPSGGVPTQISLPFAILLPAFSTVQKKKKKMLARFTNKIREIISNWIQIAAIVAHS